MDFEIPFFPEQASTIASLIDLFTFGVIGLGLAIGVVVVFVIIYFVTKYNATADADRTNPIDEHTAIEITWSVIPLALVLGVFVWSANIYFNMYTPPTDTLNLNVIGKQWMWKVQHPTGQREINTMHVPVNQPVKLTMTSQDVIHSFYVPAFRIKQDVLPGRYTTMWFEATKTGEFFLLCAEYCGTEHAMMVGKIVVMEPADYERWLFGGPTSTSAGGVAASGGSGPSGEALFTEQGCTSCHKLDGSPGIGPNLLAVGSSVELDSGEMVPFDEEFVRESIIDPEAKIVAGYSPVMPTYQGKFNEEELFALVGYVQSLNSGQSSEVVVEDNATEEVAPTESSGGQGLFQAKGCNACHTTDGTPLVGPSLGGRDSATVELDNGETVPFDEEYIRESIINAPAKIVTGFTPMMPVYEGQLADDEVGQLVEYIKSLNDVE
jgi:cytochrome c oxidase subunit 2